MVAKLSNHIEKLNSLEREYYNVNIHLKNNTEIKDSVRKEILDVFDIVFGKNVGIEFEAESGMTLQRLFALTESWNSVKLEKNLPRDKWLAITKEQRVIDDNKLDIALKSGKVTLKDLEVGKETKTAVKLLHKAPSKNGNNHEKK